MSQFRSQVFEAMFSVQNGIKAWYNEICVPQIVGTIIFTK